MARAALALLFCLGVLGDKDGELNGVQCQDTYDAMSKSICGAEDPDCPVRPPFHSVNVKVDDEFRYVETSYCPPYDWSCLRSPKRRRPCARKATFKIPLHPRAAKKPMQLGLGWPSGGKTGSPLKTADLKSVTPMQGAIGVLVNGVSLNAVASKLSETLLEGQEMEGKDDAWVDAGEGEKWMDDTCAGHISGGGNYHTHIGAGHTREQREKCGLPADDPEAHSALLGWAFDGYAIYGPNEDGEDGLPDGIDACRGHIGEAQGGYHYHLSKSYPYSLECYHGCPEPANNFRFKSFTCEPADSRDEL